MMMIGSPLTNRRRSRTSTATVSGMILNDGEKTFLEVTCEIDEKSPWLAWLLTGFQFFSSDSSEESVPTAMPSQLYFLDTRGSIILVGCRVISYSAGNVVSGKIYVPEKKEC